MSAGWRIQRFDDSALAATYNHYRATLDARDAQLEAIQADLVWAATVRRPGGQAGRLPGCHPPGCAHLGQRGRRLAPVRHRPPVHGLLRADPPRILQRHLHLARPHHQVWQRPPAHPADLGRPGPTSTDPRRPWSCAAASRAWPPRPSLGPGPPSYGCAAGSVACRPARTPSSWWSSRSLASRRLPVGRDDC